jgi:ubiquinone/menaquinone biosynthesis C-methylase UbiE
MIDSVSAQTGWQVADEAAELYQLYLVPAVTAPWAADLVERAALRRQERVLDVACGTGVVARLAAEGVGLGGRVVGLDVNPGMLSVARSLPAVSGPVIEWRAGSVLALPFAAATFDVVFCQLGLQFFADRPLALGEIRRVLVPGGRLALSVFAEIEHNPAARALAAAVDRHLGQGASLAKRAEHALSDAGELRALLADAGFDEIAVGRARKTIRFPSAREYARIQLAATPLAALVTGLDSAARRRLIDALAAELDVAPGITTDDDVFAFPQELHVALACRSRSRRTISESPCT